MPTLFISYKRGTAAIQPLRERLHAAKYRTWYDKEDIHASENWREAINQGVDHSDALIVGLTGDACDSKFVQHEVKRAREKDKPIFPVKMEQFDEAALDKLGLADTHYLDFTGSESGTWDRVFEKLLDDLKAKGLGVSRHDLRRQRDLSSPTYTLHQHYLTRLAGRIGLLNLAQIDPQGRSIELERIYIDGPTPLRIGVEVQDWRVVDWWFAEGADREHTVRRTPEQMGLERAPLLPLIGRLDARIEQYRAAHPKLKPDDKDRWRNRWNNGPHENTIRLNIGDVAAARDQLVVLGGPGSGKSTFVRYLALCLAGAQIDSWKRPAGLNELGLWPHGKLTPVYVELRRFVASPHYPALHQNPTADHLWQYIKTDFLGDDLRAYADELQLDLAHGQAVLILDGLDEVRFPEGHLADRQRQLRELALSLNTAYRGSRIIVASRPYAYEGWTLPGFMAITLADFEDEHRIALAKRLYRAAELDETRADEKAEALNAQLNPIDPALKDRPLFLTLMATIFLRNGEQGLPARKGALYRQSILLLLDRWTQTKPGVTSLTALLGGATLESLYERLAALAYEVHASFGEQGNTPEVTYELILRHLRPLGKHVAVDLITYLSENAAVLVCPGQNQERDVFHFAHRSFQEYLAACHLVRECSAADSYNRLRELIQQKPQLWRDPGRLVGDALLDTGKPGDLWGLVDDLIGDEAYPSLAPDDPRWWALWLAVTITDEQGLLDPQPTRRREKAVCDGLRESLVALVETAQALPPPERAQGGRTLSLL